MSDTKKLLEQLKRDLQTKQFREGEAKGLMDTIGDEIQKQLTPAFRGLAKELKGEMSSAFSEATSKIQVEVPPTEFPDIPAPQVHVEAPVVNVPAPVVNVPAPIVNIPETKFPEPLPFPTEFGLRGIDKSKPLPVMMMGADGKPAQFPVSTSSGGGRGDFFTIKDIQTSAGNSIIDNDGFVKVTGSFNVTSSPFATYYASDAVGSVNIVESITLETRQVSGAIDSMYITGAAASTFAEIMNPDGRVKVELPTGSSGLTDTELRATAVPVSQVSDAAWSVVVNEIFGSTAANVVNPDGRLKVELPTGSSGLTDTELRAAHLDVDQLSGAAWSVYANNPVNQGDAATALRVVVAGNSDLSTVVNSGTLTGITNAVETRQVSGAADSVFIVGPIAQGDEASAVRIVQAGNSISSTSIAAQGITLDVRQVSGASNSVNVVGPIAQGDEASAIRVVQAGNSISSTFVSGAADSFFAYEVMTTNKTAKSDGADIRPKADDLGRQVTRNIQVRDLIKTAYASVSTGIETTLLAGTAGSFNDLVMLTATNASTAAVTVDIREATAGNIVHTMVVPASTGPIGFAPAVPYPQSSTGNNWTVDVQGSDVSNTNVYFSALFSTEI